MYWGCTPDIYSPGAYDHRPVALSFTNFLNGVPLNNGRYQELAAQVSDANLRVIGQKDVVNGNAQLWIQNRNHTWRNVVNGATIAPVSGTVQISGFVPGRSYAVQWWDTYLTSGQLAVTTSATAASDGSLTLSLSQLTSDVAAKIVSSTAQNAPTVGTVSPASGSGTSGIFSFTFSDPDGWQDLGVVNVLVNSALDGRQACYLAYSRPLNQLYLVNDAGSGLLPGLALGSAGSISNSQCAICIFASPARW